MELTYTVSKEKGGQWYAHKVGFPGIPCMISGCKTFGDKKRPSQCRLDDGVAVQRIYGFTP